MCARLSSTARTTRRSQSPCVEIIMPEVFSRLGFYKTARAAFVTVLLLDALVSLLLVTGGMFSVGKSLQTFQNDRWRGRRMGYSK